jgi:hypothetical protein
MPFARHFLHGLATRGELVFVTDGSQTGRANTTLMLSVLYKGFAVPVAWVVKRGGKSVRICSGGCLLVVLGDVEFDGQGSQEWCNDNHWSFVLRTSTDHLVDFDGEVARFDSIRTPAIIASLKAHCLCTVYWQGKRHSKPVTLLTNI